MDSDATGSGAEPPEARPGEVELRLRWEHHDGGLRGELQARNVSDRRVRLSGKPGLKPLGADGVPLDADTVVSLELVLPGYVELDPGEHARAPVSWRGWNGPASSGRFLVRWPGGEVEVTASGPVQPQGTGPATHLSSSWFERME